MKDERRRDGCSQQDHQWDTARTRVFDSNLQSETGSMLLGSSMRLWAVCKSELKKWECRRLKVQGSKLKEETQKLHFERAIIDLNAHLQSQTLYTLNIQLFT